MSDERSLRGELAAAALGRLSAEEWVALQAQLDADPEARRELDELREAAALLPLADPARLDDVPRPAADLGQRIQERVEAERRAHARRRRGRALLAAAAVVLAAGVTVGGLIVANRSDGPGGTEVALVDPSGTGAAGSAVLVGKSWGTDVTLEADGLEPGVRYWLWLTDEDDQRVAAGTFLGTGQRIEVRLAAAVPLYHTTRVWVTDPADEVVLDAFLTS